MAIEHARRLLVGLNASHAVGQRDRAVIGMLIYTAARVGAVAKLWRSDFYEVADQHCLRFHEKGGKIREIPVRHDLLEFLHAYFHAYLDVSGYRKSFGDEPYWRAIFFV